MASDDEFYKRFRAEYPEVSSKVDEIYERHWGFEIDEECTALWFESFAQFVNSEMMNGSDEQFYQKVFEFLRKQFVLGNDCAKKSIDVSIVENLFWQVTQSQAKPYWDAFPAVFKELYVEFHGKQPA